MQTLTDTSTTLLTKIEKYIQRSQILNVQNKKLEFAPYFQSLERFFLLGYCKILIRILKFFQFSDFLEIWILLNLFTEFFWKFQP